MRDFVARLGILGELLLFLWKRKLYWLLPMIIALLLIAVVIVLGNNPVTAPFIYTLF